jgi:hypothetical protein
VRESKDWSCEVVDATSDIESCRRAVLFCFGNANSDTPEKELCVVLFRMDAVEITASSAEPHQVQFTLPQGTSITIGTAALSRSPVLYGALHSDAQDSRGTLFAPAGYLSAWLAHIGASLLNVDKETTESLLMCLKVCLL